MGETLFAVIKHSSLADSTSDWILIIQPLLPLRMVFAAFTWEINAECLRKDNKCCHIVLLGSFDFLW